MNIAIYMRVSTKKQADSKLGLEAQERNIISWIKNNYPYEIYNTNVTYYIDEGISGSKFDREQLQKMLKLIQENYYDVCVIYKVDRLARDVEISAHIKNIVSKTKCVLCSTTENFDLKTIEGQFIFSINFVFGEYERSVIKKRTEDSQISRLKRNEYPFRASFGYRRVNKDIIIHEEEAEIVRYIFNKYLETHSYEDVRIEVFNQFHLNISSNTVYKILTKLQYTGCCMKHDILYENVLPIIINKKIFEKVQNTIKESFKTKRADNYLAGDLVFCSKCKNRCIKNSVKKTVRRYYYYRCEYCNQYINIESIEYAIKAKVCYEVINDKYNEDCKRYVQKITYLENRLKKIVQEFALGMIEIMYYDDVVKAIEKEINHLKDKVVVNSNVIDYDNITSEQKTLFYQKHVEKIYIDFGNKCVSKIIFKEKEKK